MSVHIHRLLHVGLNVAGLPDAAAFYEGALGFTAGPAAAWDPALARLFGAKAAQSLVLARGGPAIELTAFDPPGAPYPAGSRSNDLWFQHCALPVADMGAAYARLLGFPVTPISRRGPERLPPGAGSVTAFKFRDPEGHPLELIHFPARPGAAEGIDHSALAVADAAQSVAFYAGLGLRVGSQGLNTGPEQDALDGLDGAAVDVVALLTESAGPHVELLGYRAPAGRAAAGCGPTGIASSRLVMAATGLAALPDAVTLRDGCRAALLRDPDGHVLLLIEDAPQDP